MKIALLSFHNAANYGAALQAYALQHYLDNQGFETEYIDYQNDMRRSAYDMNFHIRSCIKKHQWIAALKYFVGAPFMRLRKGKFTYFYEKLHCTAKTYYSTQQLDEIADNYDKYVVGSDQVWNPRFGSLSEIELLKFVEPKKRVSYAASFGISKLPEEYKDFARKELNKFNNISVRENEGKAIVEELTNRKDVEVLVDPTMLLSVEEWDKVSKKPENLKEGKYILNYFLGKIPEDRDKEIKRIAKENGYYIINILDKEDPLYCSGPSEFVYLEKHAELICTDSFHSVVFAILFNRPFIVFERKENNNNNMSSRLYTLLSKFSLTDRFFQERIDDKLLKNNYENVYKVLEEERIKSNEFLKKALKS